MKENALIDRILQVYHESSKVFDNKTEKKENPNVDTKVTFNSAVPEIDGNYLLFFNEIYTNPIRKWLKKILKKLTWSILKRQVYFNSAVRRTLYELIQKSCEYSINNKNINQQVTQVEQKIEILPHLQEKIEQLAQVEQKIEILPHLQEKIEQLAQIEQKIEILPHLQEKIEQLAQVEQKIEILPHLQEKIEQLAQVEQKIEILPQLQEKIENLRAELQANKDILSKFASTEEAKIKSGLWFNDPIWVGYRDDGEAYWVETTERILEKTFVIQSLSKLYTSRNIEILDVGSAESLLPYELASFNYSVTAIDIRPIALFHPNLKFVKTDICKPSLPAKSFDCVIALSTLEHIGLGWYGDKSGESLDIQAVKQIYSLLKPEGSFILTVPYGKKALTPVHRIYDRASLKKLIKDFQVTQILYGIRKDDFSWITVEDELEASVKEHNSENYLPGAVAMIICKKGCK